MSDHPYIPSMIQVAELVAYHAETKDKVRTLWSAIEDALKDVVQQENRRYHTEWLQAFQEYHPYNYRDTDVPRNYFHDITGVHIGNDYLEISVVKHDEHYGNVDEYWEVRIAIDPANQDAVRQNHINAFRDQYEREKRAKEITDKTNRRRQFEKLPAEFGGQASE